MKDNLEKFIQENRDAMDHHIPGDETWSSIERRLPAGSSNLQWFWKAAAVIFFITTVGLAVNTFTQQHSDNLATTEKTQFDAVEDFYFSQISEKQGLIAQLQDDSTDGISVIAQLQKLDAMYLVLRQQYEENPSPEVIDALTLNLLVRIDLLNQALEQLDGNASPGPASV